MGTICHVTPVLNDILDLCRFDLMYLTPHQNFIGAFCHITPVLNYILDLCRFDLMKLIPRQNFTGCISSRYTTAVQPIVSPKRSTMLKSISCFINFCCLSLRAFCAPPYLFCKWKIGKNLVEWLHLFISCVI